MTSPDHSDASRPETGLLEDHPPIPVHVPDGPPAMSIAYFVRFYWYVFVRRYLPTAGGPLAVVLIAAVVGGAFDSYGLPRLFWRDSWPQQLLTGVAAWSFLIGTVCLAFMYEVKRFKSSEARAGARGPRGWAWHSQHGPELKTLFLLYLGHMLACWLMTGLLAVTAFGIVSFASHTRHVGIMAVALVVPLLFIALVYLVASGAISSDLGRIVEYLKAHRRFVASVCLVLVVGGVAMIPLGNLVFGVLSIAIAYAIRAAMSASSRADASGFLFGAAVIVVCSALFGVVSLTHPAPAIALCTLLVVAVAIHTSILMFGLRSWVVATVLFLGLLLLAGNERFKIRLRDLGPFYSSKAAGKGGTPAAPPPPATGPAEPMSNPGSGVAPGPVDAGRILGSDDVDWEHWSKDGPRPLVLLCASGGGISAAVWTCAVLNEICADTHMATFPYHIRTVTGASGGMVGAAMFVCTLQAPTLDAEHNLIAADPAHRLPSAMPGQGAPLSPQDLTDMLSADCLGDVVQTLAFNDVPRWLSFGPLRYDRGEALQTAWHRTLRGSFDGPFALLRQGERAGWRPSLIFSPVMVEDGRRLLVSNLDLEGMAKSTRTDASGATRDNAPDCEELFKRFPGADGTFRIGTAARINAAFPFVSPTPVIPINGERRRLADAGYFDNFGVDLACRWLSENEKWVSQHASRVLILQIRTFRPEDQSGDRSNSLTRAAEDVTGPPEGALNSRNAMARSRNDRQIEDAIARYHHPGLPPVTTEIVECPRDRIPLTWRLTDGEKAQIVSAAKELSVQSTIAAIRTWFRGEQQAIDDWTNDPACARIVKDRTLRVAVSDEPQMGWFVFLKGPSYAGFDVSLAEHIATRLQSRLGLPPDAKVRVQITGPFNWDQLLSKPRDRTVDLVITSISYKPDRERRYGLRFSVPYHVTGQSLVCSSTAGDWLLDPGQWKGRVRVGIQGRTTSDTIARHLANKLQRPDLTVIVEPKDDFQTAVQCLSTGPDDTRSDRVDVVLTDTAYTETLGTGGQEALRYAPLDPLVLGTELPTYLRNDYYSVAIADDCPRLLWEVNSILMELGGGATKGSPNELRSIAEKAALSKGVTLPAPPPPSPPANSVGH